MISGRVPITVTNFNFLATNYFLNPIDANKLISMSFSNLVVLKELYTTQTL